MHGLFALLLTVWSPSQAQLQPAPSISLFDTFTDLRHIAETGDFVGFEVAAFQSKTGPMVTFQCAQGDASAKVTAPATVITDSIKFTIVGSGQGCDGSYLGTLTTSGMSLRDQYGNTALLPRHKSYWDK